MDNEDQVKDLVEQSKLIFLREIFKEFRERQAQYNLADEFAKTKKNRNPIILAIIVGMIVLFAIGSIGITLYIENNSKNIEMDIRDFEDVNLKEVLDTAKRNEDDMEDARRRLRDLIRQRDNEIEKVREDAAQRIELLANERLSEDERQSRIAGIRREEENTILDIEEEYAEKIAAIEQEIAEIQEKMDAYDTRLVEQARAQEEVLNNQRRLFEIEMENTTQYYEERIQELTDNYEAEIQNLKDYQAEFVSILKDNHAQEIARLNQEHEQAIASLILKYNPRFTGREISRILSAPIRRIEEDDITPYRDIFGRENILSSGEYAGIGTQLEEYARIIDSLQDVPYINSIDPAIDQLEYRAKRVIGSYDNLVNRLADTVEGKNEVIQSKNEFIEYQENEINRFFYVFNHLIQANRENGYVLDPRDLDRIVVYLDKIRTVPEGTLGYVFRRDDEFIAVIRFYEEDDTRRASLVQLAAEDKQLEPFDKILIQVQ